MGIKMYKKDGYYQKIAKRVSEIKSPKLAKILSTNIRRQVVNGKAPSIYLELANNASPEPSNMRT